MRACALFLLSFLPIAVPAVAFPALAGLNPERTEMGGGPQTSSCDTAPVDASLPPDERTKRLSDRALACAKSGKALQTIALFSEIIGIEPGNADAYLNRGSTYLQAGQAEAGLADYARAIALKPERYEGWYNRGTAYLASRRYDLAIGDLSKAIALKPDLDRGYCNRGLAYLRQGALKEAKSDFDRGVALNDALPICFFGRGEIALSEQRYRAAIEDLSRGLALKPAAEALVHRAMAYERLGERSDALADYRQALSLRPRMPQAASAIERLSQETH